MSVQLGTNVGWYIMYKVEELSVQLGTNVGWYIMYKVEELSVQLGTKVGWYFMYKVGGIVCTVMYERRLVLHVQSRRNCLYS